MKGCLFTFTGNNNEVVIGDKCALRGTTMQVFDDNNMIVVGESNDWDKGCVVVVEEGTKFSIGKNCQIATRVSFRTSDGHSIIDYKTGIRINPAKDIVISDRLWCGENVKILKGAVIGSDVVIGSASVVTCGKYEKNSVYVGNPAKRVKQNCHWIAERI